MKNPVPSTFNWQGKSKVLDRFGRIKTDRQVLLDATRVNKEVAISYSTKQTNSERAPR